MKLGSSSRRKQEDLDHLGRLLEGLQLDKDILLQLKVTFFRLLHLTILSLSVFLFQQYFHFLQANLQAKVARKLAGKKR